MNKLNQLIAFAMAFFFTSYASAAGTTIATPDLSPIVTMITGLVAVVTSIGMAVLSVYATAKVFKWVKTAF